MRKTIHTLTGGIILLLFLMAGSVRAQNVTDLRFNEVLVHNDSLNVDEFGEHGSWIEIFNTGYNKVNIGGCYLTNDMSNPKKYWIPTGDPATIIPSRCYLLFWADGKPSRGILHLNFDLENTDSLALFDGSGRVLIDRIAIPQPQKRDISYGYEVEGGALGEEVSGTWKYLPQITPASNNDHTRRASSGEQFIEHDPDGLGMAAIALSVVFTSLALLYVIFKNTGNYFQRKAKKAAQPKATTGGSAPTATTNAKELTGEVSAAIAMTIHLYQEDMHDDENMVLTIKRISRSYSPWSSKIYTLRKNPR